MDVHLKPLVYPELLNKTSPENTHQLIFDGFKIISQISVEGNFPLHIALNRNIECKLVIRGLQSYIY